MQQSAQRKPCGGGLAAPPGRAQGAGNSQLLLYRLRRFLSSGVTAASREQPCEMLQGLVGTASGKPPVPAGEPNGRGTGWGGEEARLPQGKQSQGRVGAAGSEAVQEAQAERASMAERSLPHLSLVPAAAALEQPDPRRPQRAQVWRANRDGARSSPGPGGCPCPALGSARG